MSAKKPVAFPWLRPGEYFQIDSSVFGPGLLTGRWSRSTEDLNNDGVPEVTTTRTRDGQGRVTQVAIVDARDAGQNRTILLTYDDLGRVVKYDFQGTARPHTTTYEYDAHDHLVKETAVTTDLDGIRHTFIAAHTFDNHGAIAATIVTNDAGKKVEERRYTPQGALESLTTYDDAGNVVHEERSSFDGRHRLTQRRVREFLPDPTSGKARVTSDDIEDTTYQGLTDRLATLHHVLMREFENPPGVFTLFKNTDETTTFAPPTGGIQHFEGRTFTPGADGKPVETALDLEDTTFDAKGRQIAFKGTNTGESKAVSSVTTYGTITVVTTDLGAGGTADEEAVTIANEAGQVVQSRDGKPDFGPFTTREKIAYDDHGEVSKRITWENNSDTPSRVVTFS